jgi:hypothetical protein
MNFSPSGVKAATTGKMDLRGEFPRFSTNEPGARETFDYTFDLPIEMTQYPMFTLKYRARNIDTNNTWTCIWITEGDNNAIFPLIDFDKLTVDGEVHEIQMDLPKAPVDSKGTPFESGPVKGVEVSVMSTDAGPGSIELVDLTFNSSQPPQNSEADQPIRVRVLDPQDHPIKGAALTVDAERKDAAKSFTTDSNGMATITPIKNELDQHAIDIEAPGLVPVTKLVKSGTTDVIDVPLIKGMQLGGFVQDEAGKPIAGASVDVQVMSSENDPTIRMRRWAELHTNDKGQWLSPPLPESDQLRFVISHSDYVSDHAYGEHPEMLDELRSGIATTVLKK